MITCKNSIGPDMFGGLQCSRAAHPDDSTVKVTDDVEFGGGSFNLIAGPCTVESREQVMLTAEGVKEGGADLLRGGAFKSRTSPYSYSGMGEEGIEALVEAGRASGLPVVSEIIDPSHLPLFKDVDVLQVGERNMHNTELLRALGGQEKPVILKRSRSATIEELLLSAEYILSSGNRNVILCERGIRTFGDITRNTLDIAAVPLLKKLTHLPVIVDPSHATGIAELVLPMSLAAAAAGADGIMTEVHISPEDALCDGMQSITTGEFAGLAEAVRRMLPFSYGK